MFNRRKRDIYSLWIAFRFSRSKQKNTMISFISLSSIIGISLGVAIIIIGLSTMNGFKKELQTRILNVIPQVSISSPDNGGAINDWSKISDNLSNFPNVKSVTPSVHLFALLINGSKSKGVAIRGVDTNSFSTNIKKYIIGNDIQKFKNNENDIIIGQGIAKKLNVKVGDELSVYLPGKDRQNINSYQIKTLKVSGLIKLSGEFDNSLAFIPLADAQKYLDLNNAVNNIELKLKDPFEVEQVLKQVSEKLPTNQSWSLRSWKNQYGYFIKDINLVKTIMYIVMFLIIGVACFNITSTLMMSVKDREGDIAILKTMGASKAFIYRIFIWYGFFSGLIGALLGSLIGVFLALNLTYITNFLQDITGITLLNQSIYFIDFIPSQVDFYDVTLVSFTAIMLSLVSTFFPAKKASQVNPAVALSG